MAVAGDEDPAAGLGRVGLDHATADGGVAGPAVDPAAVGFGCVASDRAVGDGWAGCCQHMIPPPLGSLFPPR